MADEVIAEETVIDAPAETVVNESPETDNEVVEESYLGDYKTKEDAEKGFAELQAFKDKQGNEIGELRGKVEALAGQNDMKTAVEKLIELNTPKEQAPDWAAQKKQWVEQYGEDEANKMDEQARQNSAWIAQTEAAIEKKFNAKTAALEAALAEERNERVKLSAEYQSNKELVDRFVSKGMSLKDAVTEAAEISSQLPAKAPARGNLPASVEGTRVPVKEKEQLKFSEEDIAYYKSKDLTDEDIAGLLADKQAAINAKVGD